MDLNEFLNDIMEDYIYDRILEHSIDSHIDELYKKNDNHRIMVDLIDCVSEETCLVCLEKVEIGTKVYNLSCRHYFHQQCLEESVSFQHFSCPSCREKIPIEKKNTHIIKYNES